MLVETHSDPFETNGQSTDFPSATFVHLGLGETPTPLEYFAQADRALRRGASIRDARQASREAISLMLLASQAAAQRGGWGCPMRQLRRVITGVLRSAKICLAKAHDDRRGPIEALIATIEETLRILSPQPISGTRE